MRSFGCKGVILFLLMCLAGTSYANSPDQIKGFTPEVQKKLLQQFDPQATIGDYVPQAGAWEIVAGNKTLGYLFQTNDQVSIPAYSGKPVNLVIGIDLSGVIRYTWVVEHHEPILLVGIPESKLQDFVGQYQNLRVDSKVRVGDTEDPDEVAVDAVTGATVTVIVVNEVITQAVRQVAIKLNIIQPSAQDLLPPSKVRGDVFSEQSWQQLIDSGSVKNLHLTRGQVDEAFADTAAADVDNASADESDDEFIDLYYTWLNAPTIGRNLLGDSEYQWLMKELKPGEHAIAVMANGRYSYKGNGFVRGGIFDRIGLTQKGRDITFHDLDHNRIGDIFAQGAPDFKEKSIFIIREHNKFDPGTEWKFNLLVKRRTGPIKSIFVSFSDQYKTPEALIVRPTPEQIEAAKPLPLWVSIWKQKAFQLTVLMVSLVLLMTIIFLQNWLVTYPNFFHTVRRVYLVYTVFFIGWYGLGQLSIVNVFTFVHAMFGDFRWDLFLSDPMIFIMWCFTAATILLWGRGIFCGWLCPFGALQELINEISRKLKVKQFELPFAWHERLWALKYLILLALFGVSLDSMTNAERLAEVEPFKTSILMLFQREWWFVLYALILLFVSIFTRKVYCRYICPLGAALAIPTKLRLFDWLKRRPECGQPCQLCAKECEIQAIHPDGRINANECHHCLDCQVTYENENRCPPLILAKKRGRRNKKKVRETNWDADLIAVQEISENPS